MHRAKNWLSDWPQWMMRCITYFPMGNAIPQDQWSQDFTKSFVALDSLPGIFTTSLNSLYTHFERIQTLTQRELYSENCGNHVTSIFLLFIHY